MDPLRVYDYLVTARAHVFDAVRPLADDAYRTEHPIGLGSLARTLHHVKAAEHAYMHRVRGVTTPLPAPAPEHNADISTADAMLFPDLEAAWTEQARSIRGDLERVADWHTPLLVRTTNDGKPYAYRASPADVFAQLVLHEVHHRAQAMHMLRRSGVTVGDIDYNALMWEPAPAE